jgi:hypothetical protein
MKNLLIGLATLVATSSSLACMGGDSIQVIVETDGVKTVVASYNKRSGDRTYVNEDVSLVLAVTADGDTACSSQKGTDCSQLKQMNKTDVVFIVLRKDQGKARAKSISEVTVDRHMAVAKDGMPSLDIGQNQMPIEKDSNGMMIMECSQK